MEPGTDQLSREMQTPADTEQPMANNQLLTVAEVATYLKLSQRTAWRWCKSGRLPAFKIGHQWRVAQRDLEEFIRSKVK